MKVARRAALVAGIAAVMTFGFISHAQEREGGTSGAGQAGQDRQGQAGGQQGQQGQKMDAMLATCMMIEGQKQIAVCQYGVEKAQNQRVKEFAQAEIKEHQMLKTKLEQKGFRPLVAMRGMSGNQQGSGVQQTGGQREQGGAPSPNDGVQQTSGQGTQGSGVQQAGGQQGMQQGGHPMLQLKQEVAEQCVATARKELSQKEQGQKFDRAFTRMQLSAHQQLLDEVTVFRRHASSELRGVLDEAQPQIERHISQLKELMQELEPEGGQRQGQNNNSSDR